MWVIAGRTFKSYFRRNIDTKSLCVLRIGDGTGCVSTKEGVRMKMILKAALLVLAISFSFVSAHASVLVPPISGQFPDVFEPCAGCVQLAFVSTTETSVTTTLTFSFDAAVYSDPLNTFCAGCLDFVYQVNNSAGSTDDVGRVTAFNFTGFAVDAGFSTAGEPADGGIAFPVGTIPVGLVDRNTSDVVGFQFSSSPSSAIPPGSSSTVLVIETNTTSFKAGIASVIDGGGTNALAFEPSNDQALTPEPASMVLFGTGILGLIFVTRKQLFA